YRLPEVASRAADQEAINAALLGMLDQLVARGFAECLEIGDGAGIGGQHLERSAFRNLVDGLLHLHDGNWAVQSFHVERLVGHPSLRESRTGNTPIFASSYTRRGTGASRG